MKRKQVLTVLIVFAVLAVLVYLQVGEWRKFDWVTFQANTDNINWWLILLGIGFVHVADFLRSIRWKIFLRPTGSKVPWTHLIAPQFVGFAGLALLGRPGELVRPYLIAKKTETTVASQIAVWFVERAFDTGAVALIVAVDLFAIPSVRTNYSDLQIAGIVLVLLFLAYAVVLYALWKRGQAISSWVCRWLARISKDFATKVEHKLQAASSGLHTLHDFNSFLQATAVSLTIWMLVALAYREVLQAFPASTQIADLGLAEGILLMGASVAGGVLQLPVIGGGSQLATIHVLSSSFNMSPELAVAAGIMFWLVTFMSVAPLGIILARFEHISLRKLSQESETEVEREEAQNNRTAPESI